MFFIFGWGHQERKDLGPAFKIKCPNCEKEEFWHLLQLKNYFTLFFIPVFPYETNNLVFCPVCSNAIEVHDPLTDKIREIANYHVSSGIQFLWTLQNGYYNTRIT